MHCSACNTSSPPQARYCIFCGAPIAATGPTERLGSVPAWGTWQSIDWGTNVQYPSGSVVVNMTDVARYGSASYYGTQAPKPSNMLFFDGRWYKVVAE